ncbi:MAG: hypothetical protein FJ317_06240, partial [SAR202 cluster bacterium]|nr:hypothetical protein [SAR202 cluster bacterium]
MISSEEVKTKVSQAYAEKLADRQGCCGDSGCGGGESGCGGVEALYPVEVLGEMPQGVVSFGCG